MADVWMRPRFQRAVTCPPGRVLGALAEALEDEDSGVSGRTFDSSAILKLPTDELRFWSPQLQLSVDPGASDGSLVHGLFGPHPTIWSLFVALYVAAGFTGSMGALFATAQWMIGKPAWAFWAVPTSVALALVTYVVGRVGRLLGGDQTRFLYEFVQDRLDELCQTDSAESDAG